MATFKIIVREKDKKEDGSYNIKIRITHKRRTSLMGTPLYCKAKDLTKKLKLKNQFYIDACEDLIFEFKKKTTELGNTIDTFTVHELKQYLTEDREGNQFYLNVFEYMQKHIDNLLQENRLNTARQHVAARKNLIRFVGKENLNINNITSKFLKDWIDWIPENQLSGNKDKVHSRSQSLYPAILRVVHNIAKEEFNDEDRGLIRIPLSPFNRVKIPKEPPVKKRALTIEQLHKIFEFKTHMPIVQMMCDLYVISFGLIGMNAVDIFNLKKQNDPDRITYHRSKTKAKREDNAEISVKIEPEYKELIEKYKAGEESEYYFIFQERYTQMTNFNVAINRNMRKIATMLDIPGLTFYSARHSWATIAANEAGVDKYHVHVALNHVDPMMRVTDIYIKKDWSILDKANRKVIDYMKKAKTS